jgi:site-specific DNA-cytosine methylase
MRQVARVKYVHVWSSEPKASALSFLRAGDYVADHQFRDISAAAKGTDYCFVHDDSCCVLDTPRLDALVTGTPCPLFSEMRNGRYDLDNNALENTSDPAWKCIFGFVDTVSQFKPLTAILECVRATDRSSGVDIPTPLDKTKQLVAEKARSAS